MVMITHHGIGTDFYREMRGKLLDMCHQPLLAMIEILTGHRIVTTQIGAAHAT